MPESKLLPAIAPSMGIRPLGQGASDTWHLMHDQEHTEVFSGGSAGPGKTFTMCLIEISDSLRYPGTAGVLFRESAKSLRESTMLTFFEVCRRAGLQPGVHYKFNEAKSLVSWVGGSTTQFDYLSWVPSDPDYTRLGGRQYTRAGVDEANEVEERGIEVLNSRLRYRLTEFCHACAAQDMARRSKPVDCDEISGYPILWECYKCGTWTKGLLPKLLCTGNPGDYWTKYRYVYDKEGVPVKLKPHQARVLMLLDDNPDKAHVATYRQQLEKLKDDYEKQRLLNGDWLITPRTGKEFLPAFSSTVHASDEWAYDPELALHITWDFNAHPYITLLVAQIKELPDGLPEAPKAVWHCRFLQEICLESPESHPEAACRALIYELTEGRYKGHNAGISVYGDASGKNRTPVVMQGIFHNYDMIERELRPWLHNYSMRVIKRNPNHAVVRDFCNSYFRGERGVWVTFNPGMTNTIKDMIYVKESAEGGILKVYAEDKTTGIRYEKYGHCLQAHYYLTVSAFEEEFHHFVRK